MASPLISVIVPSYNHKQYIELALRSILTQNYRPIEVIVIDDGSTDGSQELLYSLEKKYSHHNVKLIIRCRQNMGAHKTINEGLSIARGHYLTILNSDDYYLPGRLKALVHALLKSKGHFAFSNVQHVDEYGETVDDSHHFRQWYVENLARQYPNIGFRLFDNNIAITTGNFFFTRTLFEQVGQFRDYILLHDYDFLLRALAFTDPIHVKKDLIAYRVHTTNTISENHLLNIIEGPRLASNLMINAFFDRRPKNPNAPWARRHAHHLNDYWKNRSFGNIKNWLGQESLDSLFQ
jgi:glycosyltransferase involved in cell wall biosynthesis